MDRAKKLATPRFSSVTHIWDIDPMRLKVKPRIFHEVVTNSLMLKQHINHVLVERFDSWCRTIQNKAPTEMWGLCCFWGSGL